MRRFLAPVLCCLAVCFLAPTSAISDEIVGSEGTLSANPSDAASIIGDIRYRVVEKFVVEFGYTLQKANVRIHPKEAGVHFVPIIDNRQASKGFVLIKGKAWTLNLELPHGTAASYSVRSNLDGTVDLIQKKISSKFQPSSFYPTRENVGGFTPISYRSMQTLKADGNGVNGSFMPVAYYLQGYDYCMYTSKVGVNFGCWSPSDNPFGYYHVTTYRKGSPITSRSQAWYADWKGRTVICPRTVTQTLTFVQCGFPPD